MSPTSIPPSRDRFTTLPIELHAKILRYIPNFSSVLSDVLAHKSIYAAYKDFEIQTLRSIFHRQCRKIQGVKIGQVFWELVFAIRQDFVKRDVARELFILGWKVFRDRHLEELLFPLGRALAWSYCLNDREDDAVAFLTSLLGGEEPFLRRLKVQASDMDLLLDAYQRLWPATLLPVVELRQVLTGNGKEAKLLKAQYKQIIKREKTIYLAEINSTSLQVFVRTDDRPTLKNGIKFRDGKAFVGLVAVPRAVQLQAFPKADKREIASGQQQQQRQNNLDGYSLRYVTISRIYRYRESAVIV